MYRITGKILTWIKDFLTKRSQTVVISGKKSTPKEVLSGVPQGSVLGPILFLIYINDLPSLAETPVKLFADDTKTYSTTNSPDNHEKLQQTTNNFYRWTREWNLDPNIKKCKRLHIGKNYPEYNYFITDDSNSLFYINNVKEEKDLGVTVDQCLDFHTHITSKVKIANRNLGIIFRTFTHLDKLIFLNLYKSIVRPHLEYASCVWSPYLIKHKIALEKVQRRATKCIKSIRDLSYTERLRKLGLPTLEYRRLRADMIQVYKILHGYDQCSDTKLLILSKTATRGNQLNYIKKLQKQNYGKIPSV